MVGQMRIQQMAFMVVAVFFFFILVGLFVLRYQSTSLVQGYEEPQKEQAISSLKVIADMPELTCGYMCLDQDKLEVMSGKKDYFEQWPVASVKVYKIIPKQNFSCYSTECGYYEIYDSKASNIKEYSTFVAICRKEKKNSYVYDKCEIGKLVAGVKLLEKDE